MRRRLTLVFGAVILLLLLIITVFPQGFATTNPYGTETVKYHQAAGTFSRPPYPPTPENVLGTDEMGRDVLSFIVYGTRLTLFLGLCVVLGRYLVALPLGIAAGFGSYICRILINQFNVIFSALPALIVSIIVLNMNLFRSLDKQHSIFAFIIVLTFVGWAKLGSIIMERVQELLARPFVTSELAIGKSNFRIALENVIPHLAAELVVLFFMEISSALAMIMQLGVFNVFIGNLGFVQDSQGGVITYVPVSFEPEWASMLGSARKYIQAAPWLVISPAVAFFISILGFNLFGEGLRGLLQQRDSRFIVGLRKFLSFRRPEAKEGKKAFSFKLIVALVALGLLIVYVPKVQSPNNFAIKEAEATYQGADFDQVLIGSEQAKQTAEALANSFRQIGLEPLEKNGYIVNYSAPDLYAITGAKLDLDTGNQIVSFTRGRDFVITSFGDQDLSGQVFDAREDDLYSIDYRQFKGKFVLFDSRLYTTEATKTLAAEIISKSEAAGVICIAGPDEELPSEIGKQVFHGAIVWVTPRAAEQIISAKDSKVSVSMRSTKFAGQGKNVIGVLKGEDAKMSQESIIIGLGYNYQANQKEAGRKRLLFGLELAKQLQQQKRNRNIIIAFWDGTVSDDYNGVRYFTKQGIISDMQIPLYIDLSQINPDQAGSLLMRNDQAPLERYLAFSISHQLEQALVDYHLPVKLYKPQQSTEVSGERSIEELMYYDSGIPAVIIKTAKQQVPGNNESSLDNFGEAIVKTLKQNSY